MTENQTQQYWFQRHPKKALSLIASAVVILALLVGELAARVLFPGWAPTRAERSDFWTYDPLLGWAHTPNQAGVFAHPDFSVAIQINSHGLRDHEYSVERNEKKRILVLGDSYGWGFGVEHRDRFDEVLELRHPDWEIINASVSGYGTDQQLLYLRKKGIAFDPDVVLLLFFDNDPANNAASRQYWYNKPYFELNDSKLELHNAPVPKATLLQKAKLLILGKTHLYRRILIAQQSWLLRLDEMISGGDSDGDADREQEHPEYGIPLTKELIKEVRDVTQQVGASLVLASASINFSDDDMTAALAGLSSELGIPYLSLDLHLLNAATHTKLTSPHDRHWNEAGHKTAADTIDQFLLELNLP